MQIGGRSVGPFALDPVGGDPHAVELGLFFLEPDLIGEGLGRRMMHHVFSLAAMYGFQRRIVQSDPPAEPFYAAMGLGRIGSTSFGSFPGSMLPAKFIEVAVAA